MERRQLLREFGHRAPMPVTLAIDEHVDDRFDAALHRNEYAGDQQSGGERQEVAFERRPLFDHMRQKKVDGGEGHHAEDESDRVSQDFFDYHFDVPKLVLEDRDGEGQRNQRERQNGDRRIDRLDRSDDEPRDDVDHQERQEDEDHAEVDPFDLFPADGGRRAIRVRERYDCEREVDREVGDLPSLNDFQRAIRGGDGDAIAEDQKIDVPQRQNRRWEIESGKKTFVTNDWPREKKEKIQCQRRKENCREFMD